MFYCLSDLVLEGFGWVRIGCLEIVFVYEFVYFGFIMFCGEDD
jgi:hypothetical protein